MGRFNYRIDVEPILVNGITIYDERGKIAKNMGQISCVVGVRKDAKVRSKPSMPLRRSNTSPRKSDLSCNARWHNDESVRNSDLDYIAFEAKLDGKKPKVFEFSIRLKRGEEEIEIGVASLTFIGVVLKAELVVPIYETFSKEAMEITKLCQRNSKGGIFSRQKRNSDECIQDEIRSQFHLNSRSRTKHFRGGDGGRSYGLQNGASIRIKCSCLPSSGGVDFYTLQSLIQKEKEKASSKAAPITKNDIIKNNVFTSASKTRSTNTSSTSKSSFSTFNSSQTNARTHVKDRYSSKSRRFDKYLGESHQEESMNSTSLSSGIKSHISTIGTTSWWSTNALPTNSTSPRKEHSKCRYFIDEASTNSNSVTEATGISAPLSLYRKDLLSIEIGQIEERSRHRDYSVCATDETSSPFSGLHTDNTDGSACSLSTSSTLNQNGVLLRPQRERNEVNKMSIFNCQPTSSKKENAPPEWKFLESTSTDSADTFETEDNDDGIGDDYTNFSMHTHEVNEKSIYQPSGCNSALGRLGKIVNGNFLCN